MAAVLTDSSEGRSAISPSEDFVRGRWLGDIGDEESL